VARPTGRPRADQPTIGARQGSNLIRDETAERVREAARKLGDVYNRHAAELRRKSSNAIGVVINLMPRCAAAVWPPGAACGWPDRPGCAR
jgi:hypothetical protein